MNKTKIKAFVGIGCIAIIYALTYASGAQGNPVVFGVRSEFLLFALTLLGVAVLHDYTFEVAVTGLVSIVLIKVLFLSNEFHFLHHVKEEVPTLVNLFGLLLGFGILAKHFEASHIPEILPKYLPKGWMGGFVLLVMVFVISSFLDNIAAAIIGGTIAMTVYNKKVHIGYIAAIVAASNAGGSGSVVGDTTTTMMWIDGVPWQTTIKAYWAAVPALLIFGVFGSIQQEKYQPLGKSNHEDTHIKWKKIIVVILVLIGAIASNVIYEFPALGVWAAILLGALLTSTPWGEIPKSLKGTLFLLSLVLCASFMPVTEMPPPGVETTFGLGFVSAVFDNIPLTKLALTQNGYDWGVLAFSVGFGGSMLWFGSSAGVAISNIFPEAKSVGSWLKHGWHIIIAFVVGFFVLIFVLGWNPTHLEKTKKSGDQEIQAVKDSAHSEK